MDAIPDMVIDTLIGVVHILSNSPLSSGEYMQFPFTHTTSSVFQSLYYRTMLVPDGYLSSEIKGTDTSYEITYKGYELIRPYLTKEQTAQGDIYYGFE